jgi:hypothetical protein
MGTSVSLSPPRAIPRADREILRAQETRPQNDRRRRMKRALRMTFSLVTLRPQLARPKGLH